MKKGYKISLIILSVLAGLVLTVVIALVCLQGIASKKVSERLAEVVEQRHLPVTWSNIDVHLLSGRLRIDSLSFNLCAPVPKSRDSVYCKLLIPRLDVGKVHWLPLLTKRNLRINEIRVTEPQLRTCSMAEALQNLPPYQDTTKHNIPLHKIAIGRIRIQDGSLDIRNRRDKLHMHTDSLSLRMYDLVYDFADSTLTYSDERYLCHAANLSFTTVNGLFQMDVQSLHTKNGGPIRLCGINGGHTDKREEHALHAGKKPATWVQFKMNEIRTSPINLIQTVKNDSLVLDSLLIHAEQLTLHRDNQYPPTKPYAMLQEQLMRIAMPLQINYAGMKMNKLTIELSPNGSSVGWFPFKNAQLVLHNLTNRKGEKVKLNLDGAFAGGGDMKADLVMTLQPQCPFTFDLRLTQLNENSIYDFLYPLYGMKVVSDIHSIHMKTEGDKERAKGTFCMEYDGFKLHVDKQNATIKSVAKYSALINALAPVALLQHNPRHEGNEPESFPVEAARDPMKPMPIYLFAPLNEGLLETVLPLGIAYPIIEKLVHR